MSALDPQVQKSFEFASDSIKQLIGLATGVTALTVTFSKDVLGTAAGSSHQTLIWAWIGYVISIVFGVWGQLALTAEIAVGDPDVFHSNVRVPVFAQIAAFVVATALIIWTVASHL